MASLIQFQTTVNTPHYSTPAITMEKDHAKTTTTANEQEAEDDICRDNNNDDNNNGWGQQLPCYYCKREIHPGVGFIKCGFPDVIGICLITGRPVDRRPDVNDQIRAYGSRNDNSQQPCQNVQCHDCFRSFGASGRRFWTCCCDGVYFACFCPDCIKEERCEKCNHPFCQSCCNDYVGGSRSDGKRLCEECEASEGYR